MGDGLSMYRYWGINQIEMPRIISADCARSPLCRSWSVGRLSKFAQGLANTNRSNACLDAYIDTFQLDGEKIEIFAQMTYSFWMRPKVPVPITIFHNQTVDMRVLLPKILEWYAGLPVDEEFIVMDANLLLWVGLSNSLKQV